MNGVDDATGPSEASSEQANTFGERLAAARKPKSLREAATRFKISHTALARLEHDDLSVVGPVKLAEIAEAMGVPLPEGQSERRPQRRVPKVLAYCANPYCPDLFVQDVPLRDLVVAPRRFSISQKRINDDEAFCDICGEPLETSCSVCQTLFTQGSRCSRCSSSFVKIDHAARSYLLKQHKLYPQDPRTRNTRPVIEISD